MMLVCLAVASTSQAQTFTDIWSLAGFSEDEAAQGVALGDFNADGFTDIFVTSIIIEIPIFPDLGGPDRLYANSGSLTFTDVAPSYGVDDDGQGQGAAWADYDNDGLLDLYVVRGLQEILAQHHLLYHQTGGGAFDDNPSAYVSSAGAGRSVCWADYNNDGYTDVFVTNGLDSTDLLPDARVFLFKNNGDGSFTDVTASVRLDDRRNGHGCAWSDYDNDGDIDLFVANHGFEEPLIGLSDPQANALYQNQLTETGTPDFLDVAESAGVTGIDAVDEGSATFGAAWADFNNDGWMDLYVTNGFSGVLPYPTPNRLYKNNRDGTFIDVTLLQFNVNLSLESSYSCTWGDYDNDGDLDLFVANANVPLIAEAWHDLYTNSGWPLYLFDNDAGPAGVEAQKWSTACASADFNNDGYLDIYSINGIPGVELLFNEPDNLFFNEGGANHWLQLELIGIESNRNGIGARVTCETGSASQTREVAAGQGHQSMDDLRVEFGLGNDTRADTITIRWPSGCVQILEDVDADQLLPVVEDCSFASILRETYQAPAGGMFPLDQYADAPAAGPWVEPSPIIEEGISYFYEHSEDVNINLVRSGDTLTMSW